MAGTALITGASSGIGAELARVHAEKRGDLVLVARSENKLNALATELRDKNGVQVTVIIEDLSQSESAKRIFDKTERLDLQIDVLINNAGFGGHGYFHHRNLIKDQQMMQVNMVTLTNLTHYYLQSMVRRNHGKILNVSSTAAFVPGPLQAVYFATKAYVTSFTQAIAEELSGSKVTATVLCPGAVATGFVAAANLEGVDAWANAKSARSVAECGYKAMEKGVLVAFNEPAFKFILNWITPLCSRKFLLTMSRKVMEKKP